MSETKPFPPTRTSWRSRKHGTRHVIDRTLGGNVVYIQGRFPKRPWDRCHQKQCTLDEWYEYQKTAKQVPW